MDFKNFCQNIDVNSIRARIPSLPAMPALPQIKLPKSLPKLRSRRIFSRSREDISKSSPKQQQSALSQPRPIPPSDFINHSPRRISTISSLMNQRGEANQSTYRSAGSVDDDYPTPRQYHKQTARTISPINTPISASNEHATNQAGSRLSLAEKLQKGYKDIAEFRLSHIFAKKTVVRKDTIQVDHYVQRYNEDREREMAAAEKRDRKIAENYSFKFKVSRQDTEESKRSLSSNESAKCEPRQQQRSKVGKSVSEQSGDESGMEATPPTRKPELAATRRKPPFKRSMSAESNDELNEDEELPPSRHNIKYNTSSPETPSNREIKVGKGAKTLAKLRSLGKSTGSEVAKGANEKKRHAPLSPQQSEERTEPPVEQEKALGALRQNLKRLQKSIKRPQPTQTDESEGEGTPKQSKHVSKTEKLTTRLRRLTSRENSLDNLDEMAPKEAGETKSPIRTAINNKLQTWKKSFKKRPTEADVNTGDETSPQKSREQETRPDNLMKKLRSIRSRKNPHSSEDIDATEGEDGSPSDKSKRASTRKVTHFEEKFEQARQRTFKKVNDKMQQMKLFHKSQEHIDKESKSKDDKSNKPNERERDCEIDHLDDSEDEAALDVDVYGECKIHRTISRYAAAESLPIYSDQEEDEEEAIEEINNVQEECIIQKTRTLWTTKNLLSDSLDSETDTDLPRVLIHQDNTDQFESTLIIAVTRPAPPAPTAIIEEIVERPLARRTPTPTPSNKSLEWIPNTEIISSFLEITPPSKRRLSAETILPAPRGHTRKMSMDSNSDSDTWMPEAGRNKQQTTLSKESSQEGITMLALNSIDENEEPWKVHTMYREDKLYKTKSIDIFEATKIKGGVDAAFKDFEEELKNEPILRVPQRNVDSFDKESSEEPDAADDDNSSRVTKIRVSAIREEREEQEEDEISIAVPTQTPPAVPARQLKSGRETLIANLSEIECKSDVIDKGNDNANDEDEEDRPPSATPSPPPNMSSPPPPLPQRMPTIRMSKPTMEPPPPPMPATKPPLPPTKPPPRIPERTPSMTRIAKPLVKTSSLRLAYNEQVKPADVGKVNKLISRFEQPPTKLVQRPRLIPRRLMRGESGEYTDDEDDLEDEDDDDDNDAEDDEEVNANSKSRAERDTTPTNTPRTSSVDSTEESSRTVCNTTVRQATTVIAQDTLTRSTSKPNVTTRTMRAYANPKITIDAPKITLNLYANSNASISCASSEYGSPLEYPSSLIGSTETTPIPERRQQEAVGRNAERSRRSMTRDDEKFLSFDSDEENSYYSISSSSSSRYVVEI